MKINLSDGKVLINDKEIEAASFLPKYIDLPSNKDNSSEINDSDPLNLLLKLAELRIQGNFEDRSDKLSKLRKLVSA